MEEIAQGINESVKAYSVKTWPGRGRGQRGQDVEHQARPSRGVARVEVTAVDKRVTAVQKETDPEHRTRAPGSPARAHSRARAATLPEIDLGPQGILRRRRPSPPRRRGSATAGLRALALESAKQTLVIIAAAADTARQAESLHAVALETAKQTPVILASAASAAKSAVEIEKQTPLLHQVVASGAAAAASAAKGASAAQLQVIVNAVAGGILLVIVGVLSYLGLGPPRQPPPYAPPPGYVLVPAGALPAAPVPLPRPSAAPAPAPSR